nr:MAG TPA: hypothetical protein [Caudoviricetes sp.]
MTRDEIVTALRCCANHTACNSCELRNTGECLRIMPAAADLIENQQRHIEALMKANDSLKDAIARRDKQIEDMKQGMAQLAKAVAVKEENNGTTDTAYEDTGLTPGDIKELLDMAVSKTDKVLRLKEELHTMKNELCQYCGKYKQAHEGACDGCKWREM